MRKKDNDKISVIIATYNRENYLKTAINSVLKQSYKDVEIIIIDDCSKDNTKNTVENIKSDVIKYHRNDSNKGCGYSRKLGMEKFATGKYVIFLDDDDKFTNFNYFEEAIKMFNKNKNLSMVCAPHIVNDVISNKKTKVEFKYQDIIDNKVFFTNFGNEFYKKPIISVAIIKKDALEFANYHEMKILNDTTIFLRALLYGPVGFINEISAEYLVHGNNISFNCSADFIIDNLEEKYKIFQLLECNESKFSLTEEEKNIWLGQQLDITIIYFIKGSKPNYLNYRKIVNWYKKRVKNKQKIKEFRNIYKLTKKNNKEI